MNGISLFSGAGGLDLGVRRALRGFRTVCYVEREAYAAATLVARIQDGSLDEAPVWDDVATFDGHPLRGKVDWVFGDSHARTFPRQVKVPEFGKVRVLVCGSSSHASSTKCDLPTCSLKTSRLSFAKESASSFPILPRSGSMRNGACYPRVTSEPPTGGEDSSYSRWPTPTVRDYKDGAAAHSREETKSRLGLYSIRWQTPTVTDTSRTYSYHGSPRKPFLTLAGQAIVPRHFLRHLKTRPDGKITLPNGLILSPPFVEALMGWPIGWTVLDSSVMESFRCRQLRLYGF